MALFIYPPTSISTTGLATEAKQDSMITELQTLNATDFATETTLSSLNSKDFATQTTLALLEAKDFATQTTLSSVDTELALKLDEATWTARFGEVSATPTANTMLARLKDIDDEITSLNAKVTAVDTSALATEVTLAALNAKVTAVDTGNVTVSSSALPTGASTEATLATRASETTLSALNAKVTTVDTSNVTVASSALPTGASTAANQTTANASLSNIETDIGLLEDRLAGALIPDAFDYIALTYVAAGNGIGEIETATYKTGGAAGSTVGTLTLAYDASDRISTITKS